MFACHEAEVFALPLRVMRARKVSRSGGSDPQARHLCRACGGVGVWGGYRDQGRWWLPWPPHVILKKLAGYFGRVPSPP
jgi:hypothetical protein